MFQKNDENSNLENKQILYTVMPKNDYTLQINNYSSNERALISQLWEGLSELKNNGIRMVSVNKIEHSPDFKEWTFYHICFLLYLIFLPYLEHLLI